MGESGSDVRWCAKCDRPDRDLGLEAMKRAAPGTTGWERAMSSAAPNPCECADPEWEAA